MPEIGAFNSEEYGFKDLQVVMLGRPITVRTAAELVTLPAAFETRTVYEPAFVPCTELIE